MIIDKLENLSKCFNNQELASQVLNFLKNAQTVDAGKYPLTQTTFANVLVFTTKSFETVKMEAHVKYLDVQYMVSGAEIVMLEEKGENQPITEYNDVKDVIFYSPKTYTEHLLEQGSFAIMFPNDLHQCVCKDKPSDAKKIVVKIPVNEI